MYKYKKSIITILFYQEHHSDAQHQMLAQQPVTFMEYNNPIDNT